MRHDRAAHQQLAAPDAPGLPALQRAGQAGQPGPAHRLRLLHVVRRLGEEQLRILRARQDQGGRFGREYIGRGYGTDAMRVIVGYGFREMGLHRIQLGVAPFNPAGIRAYEKAGFVEEGRYRESVLHDGRWYDEVLMSILDHEWAARRSPGR